MAGLAPHVLHCFSRIIQQQRRPRGKKQIARTMPHGVNESVNTPFYGQREGRCQRSMAIRLAAHGHRWSAAVAGDGKYNRCSIRKRYRCSIRERSNRLHYLYGRDSVTARAGARRGGIEDNINIRAPQMLVGRGTVRADPVSVCGGAIGTAPSPGHIHS